MNEKTYIDVKQARKVRLEVEENAVPCSGQGCAPYQQHHQQNVGRRGSDVHNLLLLPSLSGIPVLTATVVSFSSSSTLSSSSSSSSQKTKWKILPSPGFETVTSESGLETKEAIFLERGPLFRPEVIKQFC